MRLIRKVPYEMLTQVDHMIFCDICQVGGGDQVNLQGGVSVFVAKTRTVPHGEISQRGLTPLRNVKDRYSV